MRLQDRPLKNLRQHCIFDIISDILQYQNQPNATTFYLQFISDLKRFIKNEFVYFKGSLGELKVAKGTSSRW